MTPPIVTPDGTEVEEVILPDGSEASEVIAPDGTVVFDAIPEIPDSENLHAHFDLQQQPESDGVTIDPLVDQSGNGHDADAVGGPTMNAGGFNGEDCATLDGVDDGWVVPDTSFTDLNQPYTIYWVGVLDEGESNDQQIHDNGGDNRAIIRWKGDGNDDWGVWSGGWVDNTGTFSDNIVAGVYNSTSSVIETESAESSGDAGTNSLSDLGLGHRSDNGDRHMNGRWCEFAVYDAEHDASTRSGWFQYATARWNL